MVVTFTLLTAAILALWLEVRALPAARYYGWVALLVAAIVAALMTHIVAPLGLGWIALFGALVWSFAHFRSRPARVASGVAIMVVAAALMAHLLPGFRNPLAIPSARLTPDALPYRLHLNFDKTIVGLLLLGLLHPRITRAGEWRDMLRAAGPVMAGTHAILLLSSLFAGYVRFDPKFPAVAPLFLWANLCLTCVAEEAFFRGFLQRNLTRLWSHVRGGAWWALSVAAVLFGVAHAAGGPVYIALSTVAGFGYGWAYLRSGQRIEASILTHFAVNATHFVFFTYPALQPT